MLVINRLTGFWEESVDTLTSLVRDDCIPVLAMSSPSKWEQSESPLRPHLEFEGLLLCFSFFGKKNQSSEKDEEHFGLTLMRRCDIE